MDIVEHSNEWTNPCRHHLLLGLDLSLHTGPDLGLRIHLKSIRRRILAHRFFEVLAAGVAGERVDRFAIESVRMSVPPVQAAFV